MFWIWAFSFSLAKERTVWSIAMTLLDCFFKLLCSTFSILLSASCHHCSFIVCLTRIPSATLAHICCVSLQLVDLNHQSKNRESQQPSARFSRSRVVCHSCACANGITSITGAEEIQVSNQRCLSIFGWDKQLFSPMRQDVSTIPRRHWAQFRLRQKIMVGSIPMWDTVPTTLSC